MSKDEEWSLKGKRVWSYEDLEFEDGSDAYSGRYFKNRDDAENDKWTKQYCFIEEDIEILRQKLIKDIDTIDCTEDSKLTKWEIIEEVLEIINKRFGVE